ncbi:MAG: histidine--tRNA ligase [Lachnospiraceae bacterium]|nr:histidine--tRNA ligase [Lachnospiraceae bacterium]
MKIKSVKGTNDYLPEQTRIRDYLQNKILEVYTQNGFEHIITPAIEDAENLEKSEGGENLNLIFKIMKRGNKLAKAMEAGALNELSDMGLRYDLTLPLSRYYANNRNDLISPMKCIQIDRVYRAEQPQKGRLREFIQCDIDILGTSSVNAEIELIATTAKALLAIGMDEFTVKINDRRILRTMLMTMGFAEEELDSICIIFDKMDKIGAEGVEAELMEKGYDSDIVSKFASFLKAGDFTLERMEAMIGDHEAIRNVKKILKDAGELSQGKYDLVYDISLVRGQGYYTGTVFEVESNQFKGAIAGGGRYDNLIGKFLNEQVPAVGFSIGFERIYAILSQQGIEDKDTKKRVALIYNPEDIVKAYEKAEELRKEYVVALYERPKKTGKLLNKLETKGYYGFLNFGQSEEISVMGENVQ